MKNEPLRDKWIWNKNEDELYMRYGKDYEDKQRVSLEAKELWGDIISAVAGLTHDFIHAPIGATRNYYLRMVKKWLPDVVEKL